MIERILLVDDDPNILSSYKRWLRKTFNVQVASGGNEAIETIEKRGPFAVIVSDMRMPGMNGAQLLSIVKERFPATVRIVLTGYADLTTTLDAVNKGNIFRFLCKPCEQETLANALKDGIKQYKLVGAEHELLDKTLRGSIAVLTEILSIVNPLAFSRTSHIRRYVKQIAGQLKLPDLWQFEMAGLLSQIGCVILPSEIIKKVNFNYMITDDEEQMFASHPSVGSKLIEKIPRLEKIASMIKGQQRPFKEYESTKSTSKMDTVSLGSQILKVARDFDLLILQGLSTENAIVELRKKIGEYNPDILHVLSKLQKLNLDNTNDYCKKIKLNELSENMILEEDIITNTGTLLIAKGSEVTDTLIKRVHNYAKRVSVKEPLNVRILSTIS